MTIALSVTNTESVILYYCIECYKYCDNNYYTIALSVTNTVIIIIILLHYGINCGTWA